MANIGKGTANTILQGNGTSSGAKYSTATYPSTAGTASTLLRSDGTNIVNTTATYPTTAGTTGTILRSDGTNIVNSTATYPATATTAGQILRADGTNWVGTTATYPNTAGTSTNVLTSDGTNWSSSAPVGFTIEFQSSVGNPGDGNTYYVPRVVSSSLTSTTVASTTNKYWPKTCTVTAVFGNFNVTVAGSNENVTLNLRVNDTTDNALSTTIQLTGNVAFNFTGLSIALTAGDFINLTLVCPTWVTNPTGVNLMASVYMI